MLTRENQLTTRKRQTKTINPPLQAPVSRLENGDVIYGKSKDGIRYRVTIKC